MIFSYPNHDFPEEFIRIHQTLQKKGILGNYGPRFNFPDEPQFFQYACERYSNKKHTKKGFGYGCSDRESEAFIAAIAESIEHYCILNERDDLLIKDSYDHLRNRAADPKMFSWFSQEQLNKSKYSKFRFTDQSKISWLMGHSLTRNKETLLPASLIYANYQALSRNEPFIQIPISTGAACGPTPEFALYRGLCEVIERDAYIITFARNMPKRIIDVGGDEYLCALKRRIERYNLEIHFILTTLDFPVTSVASILIDKTGSGPAVCAGLGSSMDPVRAIKTSALEAVRRHIAARDRFFRPKPLREPKRGSQDWFLLKKQLLWSSPYMLQRGLSYTKGKTILVEELPTAKETTDKDRLCKLTRQFHKMKYDVYYADVTIPEVKKMGLCVMKVLSPQMVPIWHDERYPYVSGERLWEIPKKFGIEGNHTVLEDGEFSNIPF